MFVEPFKEQPSCSRHWSLHSHTLCTNADRQLFLECCLRLGHATSGELKPSLWLSEFVVLNCQNWVSFGRNMASSVGSKKWFGVRIFRITQGSYKLKALMCVSQKKGLPDTISCACPWVSIQVHCIHCTVVLINQY